jgi:L,D-transpeptidase-like protein/SH3 domain-containing protein
MKSTPKFLLASLIALFLFVPAAIGDATTVSWTTPTPVDGSSFNAKAGKTMRFSLSATTSVAGGVVHIAAANALPTGSVFTSADGGIAHAKFQWSPEYGGDYSVQFTATGPGTGATAPTLTYTIHVSGKAKPAAAPKPAKPKVKYPHAYKLTDNKIAHWTPVLHRATVYAKPSASSRAVSTLDTWTTDDTQNIVLVLEGRDVTSRATWYRVRLPILPNNSTGWVQARNLGDLYEVHTHLWVDRKTFTATLTRDGKVVFKTRVGVGKSVWPTPRGEFYIRDKLTSFDNPAYGPIAFGTSARSAVLTDWPGGGFVGVHGTNEPQILPGRVSHGCIRMHNASILKLARLMPVGTPLTVR